MTSTLRWSSAVEDARMAAFGPCELGAACDGSPQAGTEVWPCEDTGHRNVCPDCRDALSGRITCPFCGDGFDGGNVCGYFPPQKFCPTTTPEPHGSGEFPLTCYQCHMVADG